jgi:hypothetical protein
MQRDMSYELDSVFSGRGAGELVQVQQTRTRMSRTPGLQQTPRSTVTKISAPLAHKLSTSHPHNITARLSQRNLDASMGRPLNAKLYTEPSDLAGVEDLACDDGDMGMGMGDMDAGDPMPGMGDITIPGIGPVSKTGLIIAGIAGFIAWKLFKPKHA